MMTACHNHYHPGRTPPSLPSGSHTTFTSTQTAHNIHFDPDHTPLSLPFKLITTTTLQILHHHHYHREITPPSIHSKRYTTTQTAYHHYCYLVPLSLPSRPHTTITIIQATYNYHYHKYHKKHYYLPDHTPQSRLYTTTQTAYYHQSSTRSFHRTCIHVLLLLPSRPYTIITIIQTVTL